MQWGGGARSPRRVLLLVSERCWGLLWPQGDARGSPIPVGPGGAIGPSH